MKQAFSLIELMVVIAIVAILAAVAVPIYNQLIVRSNLSNVMNLVNGVIDKSIAYSIKNTRFGSAYDLQLGTATYNQPNYGPVDSAHEQEILGKYSGNSAGYSGIMLGDVSGACGGNGVFYFHLNPTSLGISSSDANDFMVYCYYWHRADDTFKRQCIYSYGNGVTSQNDDLFPGAMINANSGSHYDFSKFPDHSSEVVCQ